MKFPDKEELNSILEKIRLLIKCDKNNGSPPETVLWRTIVQTKDVNDFKKHFNNLRRIYSNMLMSFILERCGNFCYPKKVGDIKPSVSSDIDIELVFNISLIEDKLENINVLYKSINDFHNSFFPDVNYNELFDINIYASRFISRGKTNKCIIFDNNETQRLWAMSRMVELIPDVLLIIPKDNKNFIKNIEKTIEMLNSIPPIINGKKEDEYIKQLYNYFNILIKIKNDEVVFNKAANAFSLTKYYEDDTYRSVGAYLHIVLRDQNLSRKLYIDSFMDNLGFAFDNLFSSNDCVNIDIKWKILRIAKYMDRMIDALLLIDENYKSEYNLNKLKSISVTLNALRKKMTPYDDKILIENIENFMTELKISTYSEDNIKNGLLKFAFAHYDLEDIIII